MSAIDYYTPSTHLSCHPVRPRRRLDIREFVVEDEVILVGPPRPTNDPDQAVNNRAVTLNRSGRAIWELCDGGHTIDHMICILGERFQVDREILSRQVRDTLTRMSKMGFMDSIEGRSATAAGMTFVIGIEDKPYFWWQTAIFLESFSGKLQAGWQTLVVVCNNRAPISEELSNILARYDTSFATGTNHANTHRLDVGNNGGECYSALNRVEALSVAAGHVGDNDMICLLDSDIFLYGDLNSEIMPTRCAAPKNWNIATEPFFSSADRNGGRGVDLRKILEAVGCEEDFKPGGVNVFIQGDIARNKKFIADCFRFAQALFLLGRVAGVKLVWMAEMPCFTLAMTANGIAYDLLEREEFLVSACNEPSIPAGTFYHYYSDPSDFGQAAFRDSKWHKKAYVNENFLLSDFERFTADATTDHERYFFHLAETARERLYE